MNYEYLNKVASETSDDVERMLIDCNIQKQFHESIDMYIDTLRSDKIFVVKLTSRPSTEPDFRYFKDYNFFQCLKRLTNHLYYRDKNNNSKYATT